MKQIVTLLGDYYHDIELSTGAIDEALKPFIAEGKMQVTHLSVDEIDTAIAVRPDVIVLFKEDRLNPEGAEVKRWLDADLAAGLTRYVESGGSLLAWHSGLASYAEDGDYIQMLRGYFKYHPRDHQVVKYVPEPGSSIADEGFEVLDEQYFVYCDEAKTDVFLRSETATDGKSAAGWRHVYGQGRVCCLTPAHRREGLYHPAVIQLLRRCVQYCCKEIE